MRFGSSLYPFHLLTHVRVCADDCLKTDTPEKCTHKMHEMPRWLSSAKMEIVKSLLEGERLTFAWVLIDLHIYYIIKSLTLRFGARRRPRNDLARIDGHWS